MSSEEKQRFGRFKRKIFFQLLNGFAPYQNIFDAFHLTNEAVTEYRQRNLFPLGLFSNETQNR